jgi:hypothetical protein
MCAANCCFNSESEIQIKAALSRRFDRAQQAVQQRCENRNRVYMRKPFSRSELKSALNDLLTEF